MSADIRKAPGRGMGVLTLPGRLVLLALLSGGAICLSSRGDNVSSAIAATEPKGTLVVHVDANGDKATSFEFMLNGQDHQSVKTTDGHPIEWSLAAGSYRVDENVPAGWTLMEVTCAVGDGQPASFPISIHSLRNFVGVSNVPIQPGKVTQCTFRNLHASGKITVQNIVVGSEDDTTAFQFVIASDRFLHGPKLREADGAVTVDVPLDHFEVRERTDLNYRPPGYKYLGYTIAGGGAPCPSGPQSSSNTAQVTIDQNGEHVKVCFFNQRLARYTVRAPMVAKSLSLTPGVSLSLVLVSSEPVAGSDGWSNYVISITNTGTATIETSNLVLQSWYSADAILGGQDDCGAAGHVLLPGTLAPGQSLSTSFGANLEPNPYLPQCANRESGFVLVEIRTNAPLAAKSWWVSYPVRR